MPYNHVFPKFKAGHLHSGSKNGPIVKSVKQAVAIEMSEKRAADAGKSEYESDAPIKGLKQAKVK